jgi:hypothetical protein
MSQPVKLSDELVLAARLAAEMQERSIAGQVEFWAKLGQSIEPLLKTPQILTIRQIGAKESLSDRISSVDTPAGRARVEAYLETRPFPHYRESGQAGLLYKTDADGTDTLGRFVSRAFVALESATEASPARPKRKAIHSGGTAKAVPKTRAAARVAAGSAR